MTSEEMKAYSQKLAEAAEIAGKPGPDELNVMIMRVALAGYVVLDAETVTDEEALGHLRAVRKARAEHKGQIPQ